MNRTQLRTLVAAGVFSTAMMRGAAYAKEKPAKAPKTIDSAAEHPADAPVAVSVGSVVASSASAADTGAKHTTDATTSKHATSSKSSADHGCAGAGGCGGDSMSEKSKK